jgi:hypothetical protein
MFYWHSENVVPTSAVVYRRGSARPGASLTAKQRCQDARSYESPVSRKTFLEPSNLTAALGGFARLVLSSMGTGSFWWAMVRYHNILLFSISLTRRRPVINDSQRRRVILLELVRHDDPPHLLDRRCL